MFVINGRKLPGTLFLISICLRAISKDFFESVLPKPELSGDDDDLPDRLLWGELLTSGRGGASFLIFISLSTILLPIATGLTLSFTLEYPRLTAGIELPLVWEMPLAGRPLEGEHDCLFGLPLEAGSIDEERAEGVPAPGLPLVAETGLSGSVVLKLGGASSEKPGISDGFHGLDLAGEVPREGTGCFDTAGAGLEIEEVLTEGADMLGAFNGVDGRRVGVDALDAGLEVDKVGLLVGVEDLVVDLNKGVEDLEGTVGVGLAAGTVVVLLTGIVVLVEETTGLAAAAVVLFEGMDVREVGVVTIVLDEGMEVREVGVVTIVLAEAMDVREVGVEGLDDFEDVDNVGRPVGVAGLDPGFPDDKSLLVPPEEVNPGKEACCLDTKLLLLLCSDGGFANLDFNSVGRVVEAPSRLVTVFLVSISKEGKRGVPGGVRSHS